MVKWLDWLELTAMTMAACVAVRSRPNFSVYLAAASERLKDKALRRLPDRLFAGLTADAKRRFRVAMEKR